MDLSIPGKVEWLEALIWPEQTDRLARLRAAIKIAAEQKPRLVKGDLRTDLAALAREAPKDATLVIFHTAVLAYVSSAAEWEEFADQSPCSGIFESRTKCRRCFRASLGAPGGRGRGVAS